MENTGDIGVSGNIQYTFDGLQGQSPPILLDAGEAFTWTVSLPTALGAHTAEFEGQWVAASGSWGANKQNSFASGTVLVESKLKLDWEYASLELLDVENNVPTMPLADGEVYTLSISLTSQETGDQLHLPGCQQHRVVNDVSKRGQPRRPCGALLHLPRQRRR